MSSSASHSSRARSLLIRRVVVGVLLYGAASCHGQTTFHRARSLERGKTEVVAAVDGVGVSGESGLDTTFAVEGRWRIGVGAGVDVGLGTSGVLDSDLYSFQGDVNWAFAEAAGCTFAFDPTFARLAAFDSSANLLWLPLLADVYDDGNTSVTLAAKYGHVDLHGIPDSDLVTIAESGSLFAFGIGVRVHVFGSFALMPELSVLVPAFGNTTGDPLWLLGLGFVWE